MRQQTLAVSADGNFENVNNKVKPGQCFREKVGQ